MRIELFNFPHFGDMEPPKGSMQNLPPLPIEDVAVEDAPPSFSTEQLEAAERAGFDKGFAQGYNNALAELKNEEYERASQMQMMMQQIEQHLAGVTSAHAQFLEGQKTPLAKLALAVARKIAGDAVKQQPTAEIEGLVTRCLSLLVDEPKISIFVHAGVLAAMEQNIEKLTANNAFIGDIVVTEDAQLKPGDCRIEWKNGSAERSTEKLWNEIEALILSGAQGVSASAADNTTAQEMPSKMYIANG